MAGEGVSTGPKSRPLNDTIAETGRGIPDDAVVEGELAPGELGDRADQAVETLERTGWTRHAEPEEATLEDAAAETEAHPS